MTNATSDQAGRQGRTAKDIVISIEAAAQRALSRGQYLIARALAEWAAHEAAVLRCGETVLSQPQVLE